MKAIIILITFIISYLSSHILQAQTLNWENLKKEEKHILNINAGWENSMVFGLHYGYHFRTEKPLVAEASISIPAGSYFLDDFKTKLGGQISFYKIDNFRLNASVHAIYRRYENPLVVFQNFGADATVVLGYYKLKWFASGEFGFDKAILTRFKHLEIYKEVYPEAKNGWYGPSTGGNFNFGIQGGYSFNRSDITLRAGKVMTQDFKITPLIPFYVQLGYNYKLD
ncbi:hypothetical protein [Flavobacterium foetidum]|uniref:hypothetical protein n=1 Tax=Flavobacterium foetidum TaxID=2026681 RepID=UPI001074D38E|nr:hypothetical protein [Flavobacterium foetidum]KAF2514574.1 hypothetical protein E0W73_11515 [Flavobacterium foetidum]